MDARILLLIAIAALRLVELAFSRHWLAAERRAGRAALIPEPAFAAMATLHAGWLAGCVAELYWLAPAWRPWLGLPMTALLLAALAVRFWMLAALGRLWNVRLVRRSEQPVITRGPYRFVRHPNYLAVIVEIAAVPLIVGAYWTALAGSALNAAVLWRRIRAEEAYLLALPAYRQAFGNKKRLIPGVF